VADLFVCYFRTTLDVRTVIILNDAYVRGFLVASEDQVLEMLWDEAGRFVRSTPNVRPLFMGTWNDCFSGLETEADGLFLLTPLPQTFVPDHTVELVVRSWPDDAVDFLQLFTLYISSLSHISHTSVHDV